MISAVKRGSPVALTVVNYVVLVGYDLLGIHYIRHPLSLGRVALASFLSYAVGNSFWSVAGRFDHSIPVVFRWGLSSVEIVKLILLIAATFWIGLFFFSLAA